MKDEGGTSVTEGTALSVGARSAAIEGLRATLCAHYVFPDRAEAFASRLQANLEGGAYTDVADAAMLCERLTAEMREIIGDQHLSLTVEGGGTPAAGGGKPALPRLEEQRARAAAENFGFARVERLRGNVGYLDLRGFCPVAWAGETACAAMNFLAHTDALIIDLRQNDGGAPAMIVLLASYLFDDGSVRLSDVYTRSSDSIRQYWTLPHLPGKRSGDKPIYLLASSFTFSGAEQFAYDLQQLKRATIVGERTRGGAHLVDVFSIGDRFQACIPTRRAINPISGTNWEGVGVEPDIAVPAERALRVAHVEALRTLLEKYKDERSLALMPLKLEAEATLAALQRDAAPH